MVQKIAHFTLPTNRMQAPIPAQIMLNYVYLPKWTVLMRFLHKLWHCCFCNTHTLCFFFFSSSWIWMPIPQKVHCAVFIQLFSCLIRFHFSRRSQPSPSPSPPRRSFDRLLLDAGGQIFPPAHLIGFGFCAFSFTRSGWGRWWWGHPIPVWNTTKKLAAQPAIIRCCLDAHAAIWIWGQFQLR